MSSIRKVNIVKKILENHLIKKAQENQIKSSYYIKQNLSPSTDFVCQKKAYYNIVLNGIIDAPQNNHLSYKNETAKMVGNDFHNRFQKLLLDTGIRRLNETTLEDKEHKIKGRIDSLIELNGELYLVELKSAKSYPMKIMSDENAPNIEHLKQLNICFFFYWRQIVTYRKWLLFSKAE